MANLNGTANRFIHVKDEQPMSQVTLFLSSSIKVIVYIQIGNFLQISRFQLT